MTPLAGVAVRPSWKVRIAWNKGNWRPSRGEPVTEVDGYDVFTAMGPRQWGAIARARLPVQDQRAIDAVREAMADRSQHGDAAFIAAEIFRWGGAHPAIDLRVYADLRRTFWDLLHQKDYRKETTYDAKFYWLPLIDAMHDIAEGIGYREMSRLGSDPTDWHYQLVADLGQDVRDWNNLAASVEWATGLVAQRIPLGSRELHPSNVAAPVLYSAALCPQMHRPTFRNRNGWGDAQPLHLSLNVPYGFPNDVAAPDEDALLRQDCKTVTITGLEVITPHNVQSWDVKCVGNPVGHSVDVRKGGVVRVGSTDVSLGSLERPDAVPA